MPTVDSESEIVIGSRFHCDGYCGTVRYVGEVPPTSGIWLGVEWDVPDRGKHDGTHNGVQYFQTRHPTSGSFLRQHKAYFGISLCEAVRQRYGRVEGQTAGVNEIELRSLQRGMNAPLFEVVGFDRVNKQQSSFSNLVEVCVSNMFVYGLAPGESVHDLSPNITEIDLTNNLLASWTTVAEICAQLPKLQVLRLSENRLSVPEDKDFLQQYFVHVTEIVLLQMDYTWCNVLECAEMWPDIKELLVAKNNIRELITPRAEVFQQLEYLDLSNNNICNFSEIQKLGVLPRLHFLNISQNHLEEIIFPDASPNETSSLFPQLKSLLLYNNLIKEWVSISELNKLKSLEELKIRGNPFQKDDEPSTVRDLCIAKIKRLKTVNGSEVESNERKGAEIDYMRTYFREWQKAGGTSGILAENFIREHPRYMELVKCHGAPEESEVDDGPKNLKNVLITLTISCPQLSGSKSITKKVPMTMLVSKFRGLVSRIFRSTNQDLELYTTSVKNPELEIPMDNDLRELSFYSIHDGDKVLVKWKE